MSFLLRLALISAAIALAGCGPGERPLAAGEEDFIAKAATAALFQKSIDIIKIDRREGSVIFTSYVRPTDGSVWKNRFRIERDRISWGSESGRWREHSAGEKFRYKWDDSRKVLTLNLVHSDGSSEPIDFTLP
jgi:hypothetical protein